MKELYTDTVSTLRIEDQLSEWFTTGNAVHQGCTIAPNIVLAPMDRILNRTVQTAQIGTTLETEIFSDLEYADDVAPLSEMLAVLITATGIMHEKASLFGMEINWSKTKIQSVGIQDCPITVQVVGNDVEVVE